MLMIYIDLGQGVTYNPRRLFSPPLNPELIPTPAPLTKDKFGHVPKTDYDATKEDYYPGDSSDMVQGQGMIPASPTILPASPSILPASPRILPASPTILPASPTILPASPTILPASPSILPASPSILPASPSILPASPSILPVSPSILPAYPKILPASPSFLPAYPRILPASPFIPPMPSLRKIWRVVGSSTQLLNSNTARFAFQTYPSLIKDFWKKYLLRKLTLM
ncbi:RNA polymerase Rpb1 repeat protein [Ancylostoma caninum]|uniref:RNA polymerase Rpb1 repeat protein n=1 Tax=Ancylostoma caninum TaxID=29170 RepID=A0A368GBF6_ANCCA|nr:RNA polymerase Rpb1 repeat protein [Ancylostoma caninum]